MMSAPQINAIETTYQGVRFRSRLEARWAVFFDALDIAWDYEPEGYSDGVIRYLPDFWLPEKEWFWEIKSHADAVDSEATQKIRMLHETTGSSIILAIGSPGENQMLFIDDQSQSEARWGAFPETPDLAWLLIMAPSALQVFPFGNGKIPDAANTARTYRFWDPS